MTEADRLGVAVARLYGEHAPRLFDDLVGSGTLGVAAAPESVDRARREWECFALYACVRGIVAGADFGGSAVAAINAFHAAAVPARMASAATATAAELRRLISARYDEYADIGKTGGAAGAATVTARLGAAAARHMRGDETPPELTELVGDLHTTLAEVVADLVRAAARERA